MPFGVSQSQDDCDGWATVKQEADGSFVTVHCHTSKQGAIDQMLAISFNEDLEPLGQVDDVEQRDEPSLVAPDFMATSARRGLELHEEGLSGDGLMPATVADARRMVNGEALSEDKWRRISPWIARHIVDLDAIEGDEITAGLVSMLLWGGGSSKESARRAQEYAERIVAQLDDEQRVDPPAPKYSSSRSTVDKVASMLDTMTQEARWCSIDSDERRVAYTTIDVREMQDGEASTLYGYAAVFDSPSEPMPFVEYVKRGAFAKTLERGADVRLLIDHEGVPLARTTSGTLRLQEDDHGLAVVADLDPNNPDAMRVMSALKRGDLSQMSFAFRTVDASFSDDRMVRELREVELFDVSVVTFPAYERTVAEIRSRQLQQDESSDNLGHQSIGVNVRAAQLAIARLIR
jgi:uncharacterized protein